MKAKVISCSNRLYWYKNRIGEVFEVEAEQGYKEPHYVHKKKFGFNTDDIEFVEDAKNEKK